MPRTPIYPEVEKLIILKKRAKLEKVKSDSAKESSTTQTPKRTSIKRKDSPHAYKDKKKERPAGQNLDLPQLISSFAGLSATMNGNLFVPENGLKNYGQSLSTACETVATTYNNYYIENFENIICNYFIYALKTKYAVNNDFGRIRDGSGQFLAILYPGREFLKNDRIRDGSDKMAMKLAIE
ncbi:uncharacterized protein EV154DRAFT_554865 [Mucor mucedo]|uniref:uncharacterized protein n=1 Tax=Mucor mucedo TaxID=29922 RepID=UPI00221F8597|nr:uncharacterized protein EV154DRAFT_554865 [Mucor mucedo]KAI7884443.1 hypothetical protein EV154DRAFT_554865 [Mucor mucedo]